MGVQINIKGKVNRNKLYGEKNRGPVYVPRFVILAAAFASTISLNPLESWIWGTLDLR